MHETLCRLRERLQRLCEERGVDLSQEVEVRPLSPDDAIGPQASSDFAIKRGKERVIEAIVLEERGQAFTDRPTYFKGTLRHVFDFDPSDVAQGARFIAVANALLRAMGIARGTLHCTDEAPTHCGQEMARQLEERFGPRVRVGLMGLQPAILASLVARFGAENVGVLDLNPDNIGRQVSGVVVQNGEKDLEALAQWCQVGLATGSSLANGTIDRIVACFEDAHKPLLFFGITIAGAAALLGLPRICPFAR